MTIEEKFAKLRELYPDDMEKIVTEGVRVSDLLNQQEYFEDPRTKELITQCRKEIVDARIKLATNRPLNQERRDELWHIVERCEWFVRMVAKDFRGELEQIDRDLERELSR